MAKRKQPARSGRELIERESAGTLTADDREAAALFTATSLRAIELATARYTAQLREAAATLRAQAGELPEYALLLPAAPPEYALLGRNTDRAAITAPEPHSYQLRLTDGTPTDKRAVWQVLGTLSPEARRVLAIICGWWAERDKQQWPDRRVVISKRLLAKACYGATDGRATGRISALLDELRRARLQVGVGREHPDGTTDLIDPPTAQPLVRTARAGTGADIKTAKRNSVLMAELHPDLHAELMRREYQRIRTDLLKGWESWELQLLLRILTHLTAMPSSKAMARSTDGKRTQLAIGKSEPMELGNLADLLPSLRYRTPALRQRLDKFAAKLAERSLPYELQVLRIVERRSGRGLRAPITGWVLEAGYQVRPLTGRQIRYLQKLEAAGKWQQLTAELAANPELGRSYEAFRKHQPALRLAAGRVSALPERVSALPIARVAITESVPETGLEHSKSSIQSIPTGKSVRKNRKSAPTPIGALVEQLVPVSRLGLTAEREAQVRSQWPDLDGDTRRLLKARYGERLANLPD
jgi:hypothetical protein